MFTKLHRPAELLRAPAAARWLGANAAHRTVREPGAPKRVLQLFPQDGVAEWDRRRAVCERRDEAVGLRANNFLFY